MDFLGKLRSFDDFNSVSVRKHAVVFDNMSFVSPVRPVMYRTMKKEIERKFLVKGAFKSLAKASVHICQGYLNSAPERTVRVRVKDGEGYITVKGAGDSSGVSRFEWEQRISPDDAIELLRLCEPGIIDKTRYLVEYGCHVFEVDEFHGDNDGLVVAEIELSDENEAFGRPEWLGREVTGDSRYYNSMLMKHPYKDWRAE